MQETQAKLIDDLMADNRLRPNNYDVSLYEGSSLMVNSEKIHFCNATDWSTWINKIVSIVFDVDEIYRQNVYGGRPKPKKGQVISNDDLILKLNEEKLAEIYKSVQAKFPEFYEVNKTKKKWITLVNSTLNTKLCSLNRYFKQVRDNFKAENPTNVYSLPKDDVVNLRSIKNYIKNPLLFKELDNKINEELNAYLDQNTDFGI